MRTEKFPFGIAGVGLSEIERRIPADEPPPLPVNSALKVIGKPVRTPGRARQGHRRRAVHRGRQAARAAARAHPALAAAACAGAGDRCRRRRTPARRARRAGDRADGRRAALCRCARRGGRGNDTGRGGRGAAPDPRRLRAAAVRRRSGRRAAAERAAGLSGRRSTAAGRRGDSRRARTCRLPATCAGRKRRAAAATSQQGFAQAEIVVEGDYRTQTQTHCCMEPHAIVADWRADGLTVWMSTQFTAGVRHELAESFGLKLSQVRVKVAAMGGGFGSKSQLGAYGRYAVMLSRQAKRAGAAGVRSRGGASRHRQSPGHLAASAHRRAPRRHADRDLVAGIRHGRRGRRRGRRQFRPGALHLPEFLLRAERRVHQCRPRLGHARPRQHARCLRHGTGDRRVGGQARHRSAGTARTHRPQPGAARGTPDRRAAHRLGTAATSRAPMPARSSAASAWRNRCGAPTCRAMQPARCACCATARWRCCRACRTSAPASARSWRRWWRKSSGCGRTTSRVHIGDTDFPAGPPSHGAAARPPPSRRPRAPPPGR